MNSSIWFLFAVLAIAVVQSRRLDKGPQTFTEKTPAIQKPQKRATKEVVVYLTPSQIAAIQEGRGFISAQPIEQTETSEENQEETEQTQEEQGNALELNPLETDAQTLDEEDDQVPSSIPVEEPNTEEETEEEPQYSWVYRTNQNKKFVPSPEDKYAYLRFYPEPETQTEEAQPDEPEEPEQEEPEQEEQVEQQEQAEQVEQAEEAEQVEQAEEAEESEESEVSGENKEETEEIQSEAPKLQRFKLVPYEDVTEKKEPTSTTAPEEEPIRARWLRLLEENRSQLRKVLPAKEKTTTRQLKTVPESTLSKLRYSAKYNDQKQAIENEEKRKKSQSEKQKPRKVQTEARTKNTSGLVRKEVTKSQRPLVKSVKVPTSSLVSIPEPTEIPQSFPIPIEILRPIFEQVAKTTKTSSNKSASSARVEKRASLPKKPLGTYVLERRAKKEVSRTVPSRKPERITVIRQI